jgi:hypothetical protein
MRIAFRKYILLLFGFLLFFSKTFSQHELLIDGHYNGMSFDQFVHQIESESGYHFYFDTAQTNGITVDLIVHQKPLHKVLEEIFRQTDLHFSIDSDLNVFITKKFTLLTKLPPGFFGKGTTLDSVPAPDNLLPDYTEDLEKEKLNTSLENKLYEIGPRTNSIKQGKATLDGYIRDMKSGEAIIGASVYIDKPRIGVVTDQYGYYSLTLPRGRHLIKISSAGMKDTKRQVVLYADGKLNIEMVDYIQSLKAVVVSSEKTSNVKGLQMGVEKLNIKTIKQVPVVFGEADVLRAVLTLPGVTSVGEGSTGFNVRGGSADQNLILFNGATIYNPSHLFGFFSSFNPDLIKDVELYKSSIPEKYGGRLSSVLDVTTRDGNNKKFSGTGGIGPLTSRLTLEGPAGDGKTSFLVAGRTTYSDWLLKTIPNSEYSNSSASFYDLNLNINHEINAKNTLYLTGYLSNDQFRLNSDTLYKYSNKNANIKWKHIYNNKLNAVFLVGYDRYQYAVSSSSNPVDAFKLGFDINQTNFRADFRYIPNTTHTIDFGISSIYYKLHPGSFDPIGSQSEVIPDMLQAQQALESAIYLGDKFEVSPVFSLEGGLRYSIYNYLGPHDIYTYTPGLPREVSTIEDTVSYKSNTIIKTYGGPEYRISGRLVLSENASLKMSFNTMRQYIHLLTNSTSISPTDVWNLSDPNIQPQTGDQYSLGYYKNLKSNTIETSIEVYYKNIWHYLDYKSGAVIVMNPHIETDVINTKGKSYGVELMIKKTAGKLNGWFSYTYSRSFLKQDDPLAGQTINNGDYYPANYDKPNIVNFIGNYKFSHRFSISVNVVYSTGQPITLPVAIYYLAGSERVYYSERNQYRVPDYFRTDFSMNIEGNHKVKKFKHSSWTLGVYNVTARKNPYSIYFTETNGVIQGYKLSIFGTAIPFITYNFKF